MMAHRERHQRGFTLIEVLVVTVVIGVIAAIAISSLFGAYHRAKQRATMADMRTISRAIETYTVDTNMLPDDSGGLAGLLEEMIPYATNVLPTLDHWGFAYSYVQDSNGNYTLESFGKDGIDGSNMTLTSKFEYERDLVLYNGVFVAAPE
jgi:type II secretion system protein G